MNDHIESTNSQKCRSCGAELNGKYCSACGEKKFDLKHDLSIVKFIENSIDIYIHFDAKFFKTLKNLFFYPGSLSKYFITGRRVFYMKPMQLFVLASVLFYFLLPGTNAYYAGVYDLNGKFGLENILMYNSLNKINEKIIKYKATEERVTIALFKKMSSSSKLFLFIIFPVWALALFALFYKSNSYYISHLVFALHSYTFWIIIHMLYLFVLSKFRHNIPLSYIVPLFITFAVYLFFAIRKFYQNAVFASIIKCMIACFLFLLILEIYRESVTIFCLKTL
jgi:hypothetical protein